jgi:MSHA biogenesis protein MshN
VSLINQVLKDLEQRHANEMAEATHNLDGLALASPTIRAGARPSAWWLLLLGLVLAVGASAAWWWQHTRVTKPTGISPASTTVAVQRQEIAQATTTSSPTKSLSSPVTDKTLSTTAIHSPRRDKQQVKPVTHTLPHKTERAITVKPEADDGVEKQMVPLRREQKAELAYQAGYDQLELHNTQRAEDQLRQALAIEPRHARARELLAGILIQQGRWVETAELMQQGVQVLPANRTLLKLYARTLMQLNRDQQAITLLREHAPPIAQDPDYFALLAALYQRQQQHLAAATTYSQILKLRPDTGMWWVGLGISLEALGKQQQAQQAYTRARQTGTLQGDLARYTDNRLLALDAIKFPIN